MPRRESVLAASALSFALFATPSFGDVPAPPSGSTLYGTISSNRTLTVAAPGPVYDVIGDLTVGPSATLTIESGVTLRFTADSDFLASGNHVDKCELIVQGSLIAQAAAQDQILLTTTVSDIGHWGELSVAPGGMAVLDKVLIYGPVTGIRCLGSATIVATRTYADQGLRVVAGGTASVSASRLRGYPISSGGSLIVRDAVFDSTNGGWALLADAGTVDMLRIVSSADMDLRGATGHIRELRITDGQVGLKLGAGMSTLPEDTLNVVPIEVSGCAIGVQLAAGASIRNVLAHDNGVGIASEFSSAPMAINYCTTTHCSDGIFVYSNQATVLNSISTSNVRFGIYANAGFCDYTDSWMNGDSQFGPITRGSHTSVFDPGYVNPPGGDYRLGPSSLFLHYSDSGGQIGAYGPGPITTSVGKRPIRTWARIKSTYR